MRSPCLFLTESPRTEGLYLSFRDSQGKKHSLCAMVDQVYVGDYIVPPRGFLQENLSINTLKRTFCLKAGSYCLSAMFVTKSLGSVNSVYPVDVK